MPTLEAFAVDYFQCNNVGQITECTQPYFPLSFVSLQTENRLTMFENREMRRVFVAGR
jgi:hypothetical protein